MRYLADSSVFMLETVNRENKISMGFNMNNSMNIAWNAAELFTLKLSVSYCKIINIYVIQSYSTVCKYKFGQLYS